MTATVQGSATLAIAQHHFDTAAEQLHLDPSTTAVLRHIKRELVVHFPVEMDDGSFTRLHGLPRPAQHRPRSGQGRPALPPRDDPRRRARAGHVHDLEGGGRRPPVRRRQGRRGRRPQDAQPHRARATHAPFHHRDLPADRPRPRHPRPRHRHRAAGDGVDHGHAVDARRLLGARVGDRQADGDRRLRGPSRGHRARHRNGRRAGAARRRHRPRRRDGRHPGLRPGRFEHRARCSPPRACASSPCRTAAAACTATAASTSTR